MEQKQNGAAQAILHTVFVLMALHTHCTNGDKQRAF
jgi:hypothetical protein